MAYVCKIHSSLTIEHAQEIVQELYETYKPENIVKLDIKRNDNSSLFTVVEIHNDGA